MEQALILFICNHGFAYDAMGEARKAGARGGTIIHGRSSVSQEKQKILWDNHSSRKRYFDVGLFRRTKANIDESTNVKIWRILRSKGSMFCNESRRLNWL